MCGRYALHTAPMKVAQSLGLLIDLDWTADYNIAPSHSVPVIATSPESNEPVALNARWGFHPHWADAKAPTPVNARAESLRSSRYFLGSFRHHRCLVPADGWYEWTESHGKTAALVFPSRGRRARGFCRATGQGPR